jgi:ligand-binding sensor protein
MTRDRNTLIIKLTGKTLSRAAAISSVYLSERRAKVRYRSEYTRLCDRVCKCYTINSGGHSVFSNFIFIVYCQRPQVNSKYRKTGVTFVRQY